MVSMEILIKFYTKPRCSLCDKARALLGQLGKRYSLHIDEINILNAPDLYDRYKYEIPVLSFPDGSQLQGRMNRDQLREKLDQILNHE
jgi:thiol-disulfide isomerase/thioredoxin